MDENTDTEERWHNDELSNFAGWYRYLVQAYPDENVRFGNAIKEVLDGFQALRFSSEKDGRRKLTADFKGPGRERSSYTIEELSEGQRYLLALYMVLHFLISRGHTVFIDEPDNFISLREIQPWLLTAEEAVEERGGQLILISHHPEILNLWASRCGLRFFRERSEERRVGKFKPDPEGNLPPSELIARGWEDA